MNVLGEHFIPRKPLQTTLKVAWTAASVWEAGAWGHPPPFFLLHADTCDLSVCSDPLSVNLQVPRSPAVYPYSTTSCL